MGQVVPLDDRSTPTWTQAVDAFLTVHAGAGAWSPGTATKYRQSLHALGAGLTGGEAGIAGSVTALDTPAGAAALSRVFAAAFDRVAPATRVRHLAALRSAVHWWQTAGWLATDPTAGWARPKVPVDTHPGAQPRPGRCSFRLDSARGSEPCGGCPTKAPPAPPKSSASTWATSTSPPKRARVIGKGGDTEWVFWQTGAALLLPATRRPHPRAGLSRRPCPHPAGGHPDRCPVTGRARLSYRRAAELFDKPPAASPTPLPAPRGLHRTDGRCTSCGTPP